MSRSMEEVLCDEGVLVSTMSGASMEPMLRARRDTVVIKPCEGRLNKYDVALFKYGSQYVLHRVVKVCGDSYVMRGDNCDQPEKGIKQNQILGVMTAFYRGEKQVNVSDIRYRIYVWLHCHSFSIRYLIRKGKSVIKNILGLGKKEGH